MKHPLIFILVPEMGSLLLLLLHQLRLGDARYVEQNGGIESFSSKECGHGEHGRHLSSAVTGRVIGGDVAKFGEFPWITSIQSFGGKHFCAGFMVNSRFVISAAHCFCKKYNDHIKYKADNSIVLDSMKVAVSRVNFSDSLEPSKIIEVKNLVLHPQFDEAGLNNDIAILELMNDMEWDNGLNPIYLPKVENEDHGSGDVTLAGWGYVHCHSFTASNELHKITVPLWSADDCKKTYQESDYDFNRRDYVCAGSDGKDIYRGDSGGPLMFLDSDQRWTAIGIVSSGKFMCLDRVPGVYTKVSSYMSWITSVIE